MKAYNARIKRETGLSVEGVVYFPEIGVYVVNENQIKPVSSVLHNECIEIIDTVAHHIFNPLIEGKEIVSGPSKLIKEPVEKAKKKVKRGRTGKAQSRKA